MRQDGRKNDQLREVRFERNFVSSACGSCLVHYGNTKVLCTASVSAGSPHWQQDTNKGWITAEYSMLPGSTATRSRRESVKGSISGRTHEISRLIGRSLRAAVDLSALGGHTITVDCDVLEADGGTRTASITGGYIALYDAVRELSARKEITSSASVIRFPLAAVSVGIVNGQVLLDLPYTEDSIADVDLNVVATDQEQLVEIQGTAEKGVYSQNQLSALLTVALQGIHTLIALQNEALFGEHTSI